jgi:NAD(P)-dependent dehydrogenase (short-subunit alcohol dehydrogenase family)
VETVRATLETNALGPLNLSQALVPLLQRSKHARIVNISSGMGAFSEMEGDYAAYRISKTALNAVTAILAAELRDRIAVNAACPGWVIWAAKVLTVTLQKAPILRFGSRLTRRRG